MGKLNTKSLTQQLLQDRDRRRAPGSETKPDAECFGCGKSFTYRGPRGDSSGRFCSDGCRIEYDAPGAFTFDPFKFVAWRTIVGGDPGHLVAAEMVRVAGHERADRIMRGGWRIDCAGCGRRFESFGLRYCKPECRRAPAASAAPAKRPCQKCGGPNPRWGKSRATRKDAAFCGRC
jgi:hypothetical protein